ncbi:MAG TPA: 1-(5-phosphoribosyl)-5-[(5-phosphoribosylamino)methylideneamino]imidazole-4-carboxamide isomerase [Haliangiales bacterium]|nr:1-(5-phosphoribosyl)-5-[(5-phosphoribosylamino)methylideneamino]imidazole-4-carboxamide isomerase [Haliangiales bacterium]
MTIIPAIDLLGGAAVRLKAGRREDATVYSTAPWEVAAEFAAAGAACLHVVDLDGAFSGERRHAEILRRVILAAAGAPVQVGGGLRRAADVDAVLDAGAAFAVIGTMAARAPAEAERICRRHPGRIVVAVDARGGKVAVAGWTETSSVDALELARRAEAWGAARILYTDVERDGLGGGPAVDATARLARALAIPVIASGGIGRLDDLRALRAAGVPMCVVGRALYDGAFTLAEALSC